jgi:hypothetical protein
MEQRHSHVAHEGVSLDLHQAQVLHCALSCSPTSPHYVCRALQQCEVSALIWKVPRSNALAADGRAMVYTEPLTYRGVWDAIPTPPPGVGTH